MSRPSLHSAFDQIAGESSAIVDALVRADRVANTPWPLLLTGETGTGKTALARAIHECSGREGEFVTLNCAALSPSLIESELFGHVKGAFTGADRDQPGLFRSADKGTLFLDEIGELTADAQAKLLRALEAGRVRAVGADRETEVDVRLIGATHRPLNERVQAGQFREDLYYRINQFIVHMPPLRDREADLGILARLFLGGIAPDRQLDESAIAVLRAHSWPGNLRELQSVLRQATVEAGDDAVITADAIPPLNAPPPSARVAAASTAAPAAGSDGEPPLVDRLRLALSSSGTEASILWARFLLAFAHQHGKDTVARPDVVELLREVRGGGPTDRALELEWNRKLRPELIDRGLAISARRNLQIALDRCRQFVTPATPDQPAPVPAPLASLSQQAVGHTNLPARLPKLIARGESVDALVGMLRDRHRLVTVLGPGGIGKTCLVREVGHCLLGDFPGGCWFVDLRDAQSATDIRRAVADVLNVPLDGGAAEPQLADALSAAGRLLLILDNYEQVVAHAGETIGTWLERAPDARFLVTSRAVLHLHGEARLPLGPLKAPEPPRDDVPLESLQDYEAIQLFVDRAQLASPDFRLDETNVHAVARICAMLEGLPLAVEMAAARLRVMPPVALAERLDRAFELLRNTRTDVPEHQRSLRRTFDWSFDLLDEAEQSVFLQLCVFRGPFSLEGAEAVVVDVPGDELLIDVVEGLVDKSFVSREIGDRLGFYPVMREYGLERWRDRLDDERRDGLARRHMLWMLDYAERCAADMRSGAEGYERVATVLRPARPDLAGAIDRAWGTGEAAVAARLTVAAGELLLELDDAQLAFPIVTTAIERIEEIDDELRLPLVAMNEAVLRRSARSDRSSLELLNDTVDRGRELPSTPLRDRWLAELLLMRGAGRSMLRDYDAAWEDVEEVAPLVRDDYDRSRLHQVRSVIRMHQEQWDQARDELDAMTRSARLAGRWRHVEIAAQRLSSIFHDSGDLEAAREQRARAYEILEQHPNPQLEMLWYHISARQEALSGDLQRATELAERLRTMARRNGMRAFAKYAVYWAARAASRHEDFETTARLCDEEIAAEADDELMGKADNRRPYGDQIFTLIRWLRGMAAWRLADVDTARDHLGATWNVVLLDKNRFVAMVGLASISAMVGEDPSEWIGRAVEMAGARTFTRADADPDVAYAAGVLETLRGR